MLNQQLQPNYLILSIQVSIFLVQTICSYFVYESIVQKLPFFYIYFLTFGQSIIMQTNFGSVLYNQLINCFYPINILLFTYNSNKNMFKTKTPDKLIIPVHSTGDQIGSAMCLSAITSRKRKSTFMTQMSKKLSSEELVLESHNDLINYIDSLEEKVQKIIESHDSQFLLAYKNHLNRVREQMEELKSKNANNANSASNQTQKIEILQKQLIIFREQALNLFDKMSEKDKNIEFLNLQIYELQTQQKYNKKTISDLMKRNKYLQGMMKQFKLNTLREKQLNQQGQQRKKSVSYLQVNSLRKHSQNQRKNASTYNGKVRNLGWTGYSFFESKNQGSIVDTSKNSINDTMNPKLFNKDKYLGNNNLPYKNEIEIQKQTRPATTAFGSKRNTMSLQNSKITSNDNSNKNVERKNDGLMNIIEIKKSAESKRKGESKIIRKLMERQ